MAVTVFRHFSGEQEGSLDRKEEAPSHSLLLLFYVRGVDVIKVTEKIIKWA